MKSTHVNMFQVNEKVRVISTFSTFYNNVGTIVHIQNSSVYFLTFPNLSGEYGFAISELERIDNS